MTRIGSIKVAPEHIRGRIYFATVIENGELRRAVFTAKDAYYVVDGAGVRFAYMKYDRTA